MMLAQCKNQTLLFSAILDTEANQVPKNNIISATFNFCLYTLLFQSQLSDCTDTVAKKTLKITETFYSLKPFLMQLSHRNRKH